ncbi:unnamed protein product, partial [Mesorhabditis belari]|uniref:Uncharacterized protein n=1 Tax=Mesorhabditis belari TaxID=2138241 RepID=A0AAF3F082_9BILA
MMDFGLLLVLIGTSAAHFGGGFGAAQQSQGFGGQPQVGYLRQGPPPSSYGPIQSAQQLGVTGTMQGLYNPQQGPIPTYQMVPAPPPSTGYVIQPMGMPQQPAAPIASSQPSSYSQGPQPPSAMPPSQSQPVFPPSPPPAASFAQDNSIGANIGHPDGHYIPARHFRLSPIDNL